MTEIDRNDTQGNILEGYRFGLTNHLFVKFAPGRGKTPLAKLISQITTATDWNGVNPTSTLNLGLSFAGLKALGVPDSSLNAFPQAFRDGMRARSSVLGDRVEDFDVDWSQTVHLWLWVHASTSEALQARLTDLRKALGDDAAVVIEAGGALLLEGGMQIEHFGFRDGISQPSVAGSLTPGLPADGIQNADGTWRPHATGEFLLGHVDEAGEVVKFGAPVALSENGTFAVFRKLEQDVPEFQKYLAAEEAKLRQSGNSAFANVDAAWIAERMVGRRTDGSTLNRERGAVSDEQLQSLTFEGDDDGRCCPLGAHVRRANPRGSEAFRNSFARHRILRRGYPYGPRYNQDIPAVAQQKRGLLFVALNADLERQFEFLQQRYINDGAAARQGHDVDPLVGTFAAPGSNFVIPGDANSGRDTIICSKLPAFVVCRGGEYFFLPGKRALEAIETAAMDPPHLMTGESQVLSIAASSVQAAASQEAAQ